MGSLVGLVSSVVIGMSELNVGVMLVMRSIAWDRVSPNGPGGVRKLLPDTETTKPYRIALSSWATPSNLIEIHGPMGMPGK